MTEADTGLRHRVIIAGTFAALAVVLLGIDEFAPAFASSPPTASEIQAIDNAVDSVLSRYGIATKQARSWFVRTADGTAVRKERRIPVRHDLASIELNRDLNRAVSEFNGHVIGSERTKESVVVLHVVVKGMTVQSISLVADNRVRTE